MAQRTFNPNLPTSEQLKELTKAVSAALADFTGHLPPFEESKTAGLLNLVQITEEIQTWAESFPKEAYLPSKYKLLLYVAAHLKHETKSFSQVRVDELEAELALAKERLQMF